ncbi:MFS transporter [Streptomyces sp. NPDC017979]|uniref:MFS transporter n=1 Tax=Streptomyces sp. NPDC017979 TaxID=3365024 RepID=UPI0037B6B544
MLRTRYARRTFGAALLGRLSYGMISLSLVLAVKEATDSYAVAGTVVALFALTSVFLSPTRAGLVDRYGPRRALLPMAVAYSLLLTALAFATSWSGASGVLLGILALPAGACTPPLGPVMRTVWSNLLPDRRMVQRAYSLDAVAEELLFVVGPLLVGLLVQVSAASIGLGVSAALVLIGTVTMVSSPAVRSWVGRKDAKEALVGEGATEATAGTAASDGDSGASRRRLLLTDPGLRQAIVVSATVGICLGAFELLVIAFADAHHEPAAVAWILAALCGGSAVGGLIYGAVSWRASSRLRLAFVAGALGLTLAAAGLSPHPYVLIAWAALGGLFIAPAITTAYLIADECSTPATRTQAGAWVNTSFNAGSAGATAAVGLLVGRLPLAVCFALAAIPVVSSAATVLRRPRRAVADSDAPLESAQQQARDTARRVSVSK